MSKRVWKEFQEEFHSICKNLRMRWRIRATKSARSALVNGLTGPSSQRWWPRLLLTGLRQQEYWLSFRPSKIPPNVTSRVPGSTHPTCNRITRARASCWRLPCYRCSTRGCFGGREGPASSCGRSCSGAGLSGRRVRTSSWDKEKYTSSSGWSSSS